MSINVNKLREIIIQESDLSSKEISIPTDVAVRLGIAPDSLTVSTEALADSLGYRLYNGVSRVDLNPYAPFDEQPIRFVYGHQFGIYPHINKGKPLHGGIPLTYSRQSHIDEIRKDAKAMQAPEGTWVFIDYEAWRMTFPSKGKYHDMSTNYVKSSMPWLPDELILPVTKAWWEHNSIQIHQDTLDAAKETRPDYKWGWYFPQNRHYWDDGKLFPYSGPSGDKRRAENDLLDEVWKNSDVMMSSVYIPYPIKRKGIDSTSTDSPEQIYKYVYENVNEWKRIRDRGDSTRPLVSVIEPHIHIGNKHHKELPLIEEEFEIVFRASKEAGADGVVIWGWAPEKKDVEHHVKSAKVYGKVFGNYLLNLL